jgi:nucleotide-binding universal stress UspA family protein
MTAIVLPTDFSELANAALPWARKMATTLDAEIHCLHVVREEHYYGGLEVVFTESLPTSDDLVASATQRMERYLAEQLADLGAKAVGKVRLGTPFVEIIRYAREVEAKLIVMSTHGHSGLKHMLLGSTTEAVLRKADCPVLSIRSAGVNFVMP